MLRIYRMRYTRKKGGVATNNLSSMDTLYRTYYSDLNLVFSNFLDFFKELDVLTKYQLASDILEKINQLLSVLGQISNKMINKGHEIPILPGPVEFATNKDAVEMTNEKKNKIINILNSLGLVVNRINSNTNNILNNEHLHDRFMLSVSIFRNYICIIGYLSQIIAFGLHSRAAPRPSPRPAPKPAPRPAPRPASAPAPRSSR
jgi:hypothetical protein